MNGMALLGWLVLAMVTGYMTFVSACCFWYTRHISSAEDYFMYVIPIVTSALWYLLYITSPFTVVIK